MELETSVKNGVRLIKFCNTRKKNAISPGAYIQIAKILNEDAQNDNIVVTIFTGTGEYFTSGNDLTKSMEKMAVMTLEEVLEEAWTSFKAMMEAVLAYPKLLIVVANGPAVGIGVTLCSLCDIAYCSETTTFQTPFVKLGLCIEGCGSYLLPRIMGKSKANELLLLGKKLTAEEALKFNLVAQVVKRDEIDGFIEDLHRFGSLPVKSLIVNKRLLTENVKKTMCECNERECKQLYICQSSEEFLNNAIQFASHKSKL